MLLIFDGGSPPPPTPDPVIESSFRTGLVASDGVTLSVSLRETVFKLDTSPFEFVPRNIFFTIEGHGVRASWDGSEATAVEGHRFYSGQQIGFTDFKHFDLFTLFTVGTASEVRITIEGA